jgi:hypothetical protein
MRSAVPDITTLRQRSISGKADGWENGHSIVIRWKESFSSHSVGKSHSMSFDSH